MRASLLLLLTAWLLCLQGVLAPWLGHAHAPGRAPAEHAAAATDHAHGCGSGDAADERRNPVPDCCDSDDCSCSACGWTHHSLPIYPPRLLATPAQSSRFCLSVGTVACAPRDLLFRPPAA